ncbi:MAG TPA: hypothetical protein VNA20_16450 [Frankiaceae bacterium]|nr:hypothetical protein [Frankiaceae bacterium]
MEQPSRRAVLRAAVVGATTVAVPMLLAAPASAAPAKRRPPARPTRLRRRVFKPLAGSTFTLSAGTARHRAVLAAVVDDNGKVDERRFSLLFTVVGSARPVDGIYTVSHPNLRSFPLYVGSISRRADGWYEAVVNS